MATANPQSKGRSPAPQRPGGYSMRGGRAKVQVMSMGFSPEDHMELLSSLRRTKFSG